MDNVRLCFVPDQSMNVPVCYITNLIDEINTFPGGPLAVHHSNGSCNPDDSTVVTLTACYENTHGLIPLNTTWRKYLPPFTFVFYFIVYHRVQFLMIFFKPNFSIWSSSK